MHGVAAADVVCVIDGLIVIADDDSNDTDDDGDKDDNNDVIVWVGWVVYFVCWLFWGFLCVCLFSLFLKNILNKKFNIFRQSILLFISS